MALDAALGRAAWIFSQRSIGPSSSSSSSTPPPVEGEEWRRAVRFIAGAVRASPNLEPLLAVLSWLRVKVEAAAEKQQQTVSHCLALLMRECLDASSSNTTLTKRDEVKELETMYMRMIPPC